MFGCILIGKAFSNIFVFKLSSLSCDARKNVLQSVPHTKNRLRTTELQDSFVETWLPDRSTLVPERDDPDQLFAADPVLHIAERPLSKQGSTAVTLTSVLT